MKRFVFAALCMLLAIGVSAANQNDGKKVRAAAATCQGENPGLEGAEILKRFQDGDTTWDLNRESPRQMRKSAVKMAYELYKAEKLSYGEYAQVAADLGFRPKKKI